jgi:hypothetical protein
MSCIRALYTTNYKLIYYSINIQNAIVKEIVADRPWRIS